MNDLLRINLEAIKGVILIMDYEYFSKLQSDDLRIPYMVVDIECKHNNLPKRMNIVFSSEELLESVSDINIQALPTIIDSLKAKDINIVGYIKNNRIEFLNSGRFIQTIKIEI